MVLVHGLRSGNVACFGEIIPVAVIYLDGQAGGSIMAKDFFNYDLGLDGLG